MKTKRKPERIKKLIRLRKSSPLFDSLKSTKHDFSHERVATLFVQVDKKRVFALADSLDSYIRKSLPEAIAKRNTLPDYRVNPYVLMTSASVADMEATRLASFISDTKLYMGLETSFGKSVESIVTKHYPMGTDTKWEEPQEKQREFSELNKLGLSRQDRAARRNRSVWREIDRSCISRNRRYLVSIKSGPNCINDTQVQSMQDAIATMHKEWWKQTRQNYPGTLGLDVIIGLTYGTDQTTNNKENQILAKLLERGFIEEDGKTKPGVLVDAETRTVRVYRRIGQEFWSTIGSPSDPDKARFVFLEMLLALAKGLKQVKENLSLEERLTLKVKQLQAAFEQVVFPPKLLPDWVHNEFSEMQLFWLASAMTAFYDKGV